MDFNTVVGNLLQRHMVWRFTEKAVLDCSQVVLIPKTAQPQPSQRDGSIVHSFFPDKSHKPGNVLGDLRERAYVIRCSKYRNCVVQVCHANVGTLFAGLHGPSMGGIHGRTLEPHRFART